jgi:hypothetical protein
MYAAFVFLVIPLLFWGCQRFYEYISEYGKLMRKQKVSTVVVFIFIEGSTPCLRTRIAAMPSPERSCIGSMTTEASIWRSSPLGCRLGAIAIPER